MRHGSEFSELPHTQVTIIQRDILWVNQQTKFHELFILCSILKKSERVRLNVIIELFFHQVVKDILEIHAYSCLLKVFRSISSREDPSRIHYFIKQ